FICEGEKDADSLVALGLVATTNPMGAKKWLSEYNESLRGAHVILLPHNDDPGRAHVENVAATLHGIVVSIRVLNIAAAWPECPAKGDISDWLKAGGTAKKLKELVVPLPEWAPAPPRLRPLTLSEFFLLSVKPRGMVLNPIILEKGL